MATFPLSAKAVFDEAVEIASPDERRDCLERACANAPALRQTVEALLSAYADAGSFLESPPAPLGDSMDLRPATERPGTIIGRFKATAARQARCQHPHLPLGTPWRRRCTPRRPSQVAWWLVATEEVVPGNTNLVVS